jgi:hypothetical protein
MHTIFQTYRVPLLALAALIVTVAVVWIYPTNSSISPRAQQPSATSSSIGDVSAATSSQQSATTTRESDTRESTNEQRDVSVTDGTRHTITLDEIISGGPGKDGIPSIDQPTFVSIEAASTTVPLDEPGIGVTLSGEARFYPYSILVWHEIVNDTIAGVPVAITYCPLCRTGIVFERTIDGTVTGFGVSGKLWRSNLLMYNRSGAESLWSQIWGEAVVGPHAGQTLERVPSQTVRLRQWRELHPNTTVLSQPEGFDRPYGRDPYAGYYDSERVSFGAEYTDTRLEPKALIVGITKGDTARAYPMQKLPDGQVRDTIGSTSIRVVRDGDAVTITDASGTRIPHTTSFWFAWAAAHPRTSVYQQ